MMGCPCRDGMSGLLGDVSGRPVHIEAPFSLGVELYADSPWYSGQYGVATPEEIAAALNESDYVSGVSVFEIAGFVHPFIAVEGYSAMEFGRDSHLRDAVLSIIDSLPNTQTDRSTVRFEVETYDLATGQTQTTRYDAQTGGSAGQAPAPGPGFFDQLGQNLGFSERGTQYAVIGAAVLLAVLLLKR